MSQDPGGLPLGLELEVNKYWCGPGEIHTVQESPILSKMALGPRLLSNTCIRWLARSATYTLPWASTAIPCGVLNSLGCEPGFSLPTCLRNLPFLSYFTTLWLMYPSETKRLPWASHATSVGRPSMYFSAGAPGAGDCATRPAT